MECDVALVGTGLAPLVTAKTLIEKGFSVIILNPDWDFFEENSELGMDPFWISDNQNLQTFDEKRILAMLLEPTLNWVRPYYPGSVQVVGTGEELLSYYDAHAPHLWLRDWVLVRSPELLNRPNEQKRWDLVESFFLSAPSKGVHAQELSGPMALSRIPGFSTRAKVSEYEKSIILPRLVDVDVKRYRIGVLEYIREKMGDSRVLTLVNQIEPIPNGLRFEHDGKRRTLHVKNRSVIYWTPKLTHWVMSLLKSVQLELTTPIRVRHFEEWRVKSRDPLVQDVVGAVGDRLFFANLESARLSKLNETRDLTILQIGAENDAERVTSQSFQQLSGLLHDFLGWEKVTVRSLDVRSLIDWSQFSDLSIKGEFGRIEIKGKADGPLTQVIQTAAHAGSIET